MKKLGAAAVLAAAVTAVAFTLPGTASARTTVVSAVCTPNGNVCATYDGAVLTARDKVCGGPRARVDIRKGTTLTRRYIPDCGTTRVSIRPPISYRVCDGAVCSRWVTGS